MTVVIKGGVQMEKRRIRFPTRNVSFQLPEEVVEEMNDLALYWKLNKTATIRRLIETAYESYIRKEGNEH